MLNILINILDIVNLSRDKGHDLFFISENDISGCIAKIVELSDDFQRYVFTSLETLHDTSFHFKIFSFLENYLVGNNDYFACESSFSSHKNDKVHPISVMEISSLLSRISSYNIHSPCYLPDKIMDYYMEMCDDNHNLIGPLLYVQPLSNLCESKIVCFFNAFFYIYGLKYHCQQY